MVSLIPIIIFLVLILIVAYAFISIGNTLVDATKEQFEIFFTTIELREVIPIPMAFEDVCDVRITVRGNVDQTLPFSDLFVRMSFNDVSYQWFDCHQSTGIPLFSIWDIGKISDSSDLLSLLFGDASDLKMEIELKSFPNEPPVIVNKFLSPHLAKTINLPSGSFPTPHPIVQEFIITNIPDRNYKLSVNLDIDIFPQDPFLTNVCKQFTTSC